MTDKILVIKDKIVESLLPTIIFDGWTLDAAYAAAEEAGYGRDMIDAVFPGELAEIIDHFSDWADRQMLNELEKINPDDLKVRDRIEQAVFVRLECLQPHKEAVKQALSYWSIPPRQARAAKIVWRTADCIWDWAGDTAKDYNRYTKRGLLSGVISATTLAWLNDESEDMAQTRSFLRRRIQNVLTVGQGFGKAAEFIKNPFRKI